MTTRSYISTILGFVFISIQISAQSLQISSIDPEKNANNVSRSTDITVTFNMSVSSASVNDSTIIVRGHMSGVLSGSLSGGGSTVVTFNPDNDFRVGEIISITITSGLRVAGGPSLPRGHTYSFTVASEAAPQTPLTLIHRSLGGGGIQGRDIKALDYDRDGDLDILTAVEGVPERIYLHENTGDMTVCSSTIGALKYIEVFDIDGDGDFDNIGTNGNESALYWFENEGTFPYTQHTIINLNVWSATGGDIDSDGDIDVVGAMLRLNPVKHQLYWYANEGSGTFAEGSEITTTFEGGSDSYFKIRDINSDGAMDILAFHKTGNNLVWYENDGNQGFTEHGIKTMPDWGRLASADLDGDSDIDIVFVSAVNSPSSPFSWFENNGSESFTEHPITTTSNNRLHAANITDLDGDQDMDIVAGNYWYENDGSEAFSEHKISDGLNYTNGTNYADMDGDGDLDILTLGPHSLNWHENTALMEITGITPTNAAGNVELNANITISFDQNIEAKNANLDNISVFSPTVGYLRGSFSGGGTNTISFDPDLDFKPGDKIEVSVNQNVHSTSGHTIVSNYGFTFTVQSLSVDKPEFKSHIIDTLENNVSGMDIADIDGDGDLDLISCSYLELSWHQNDGNGNFTTFPITISATPVGVFAFDQNQDGNMDIWVDYNGSTPSAIFTNDGNENFTESIAVGSLFLRQTTDINHDGDIDLVYISSSNSQLNWIDYRCEGYGGFGSIPRLISRDVQAGDMDNDGDNDFITASSSGPVSYENNNYFTFIDRAFDDNYTTNVYLSDLDGDGDLDPLFTENTGAITWYENISTLDSLLFGERQVIDSLTLNYKDIITADIDGDGDEDIAAVSGFEDKVVWFANRLNEDSVDFGPEQFGKTTTNNPVKILSGDLDGDGDLDLVTLSENDDELTWFENSGGASAIDEDQTEVPLVYSLEQNYPNPFNPMTVISWQLSKGSEVELSIYDILGAKVATLVKESMSAGNYNYQFNGANLASGIYYYQLIAGEFQQVRKMVLIK